MQLRSVDICAGTCVLVPIIVGSAAKALALAGAGLLCCVSIAAWGGETARAELKVISAGAVRGVIGNMIDDYARATGHTFKFTVGSTGQLREIITSGEPADLII
ncbi:MAG: substrate-binding domain-containing protein, partial [Xanthobacteraceae bacterium]